MSAWAAAAAAGCQAVNPAYRPTSDGNVVVADAGGADAATPDTNRPINPTPDGPPSALEIGLVGYWKMDDGAGSSSAHDSSNHGATGTLRDLDAETAWVTGKFGTALHFASKGWVRVPSYAGPNTITTAVTVAAWITNEIPDDFDTRGIVVRQIGTGKQEYYGAFLAPNGQAVSYFGY